MAFGRMAELIGASGSAGAVDRPAGSTGTGSLHFTPSALLGGGGRTGLLARLGHTGPRCAEPYHSWRASGAGCGTGGRHADLCDRHGIGAHRGLLSRLAGSDHQPLCRHLDGLPAGAFRHSADRGLGHWPYLNHHRHCGDRLDPFRPRDPGRSDDPRRDGLCRLCPSGGAQTDGNDADRDLAERAAHNHCAAYA